MPTNADRVIMFLRTIAPSSATNEQIGTETGVQPHQQVFQITQKLRQQGLIQGEQRGNVWFFRAIDRPEAHEAPPVRPDSVRKSDATDHQVTSGEFEKLARTVMGKHFRVPLEPSPVPGIPKLWDCVSPDVQVVGDAKYLTLVRGRGKPSAKFSMIAEHVWLLEKTCARDKFLVFGNDRRVPELWLVKYGGLAANISFFYLSDSGELSVLHLTEERTSAA